MRKKILRSIIIIFLVCVIGFISFDCYLWRLFKFDCCYTPKSLYVSDLEIKGNKCYISVSDMVTGSFSTTKYNGLIFEYSSGILKIGVHKGIIGAKESISKEITVNNSIEEVRLCGNGREQVIYKN